MTMLFQKGEDMATNILLVNQKGGVGKTTFADEIAWGLERRGHKVGFGNLDPQGGANHEKNLLDDENAVNVIDTPGFASFDTEELDLELKEHLPETFPEFAPYIGSCRFVGCSHTKEKGCAVLEAVRQGRVPRSRHASYLRLYNELKDLKAWDRK